MWILLKAIRLGFIGKALVELREEEVKRATEEEGDKEEMTKL